MDVLGSMDACSVDSMVTDPPYGWRFMGKAWDVFDIEKRITEERKRPKVRCDGKSRGDVKCESAGLYDLSLEANRAFQAWTTEWAREVYRVLKPGAHILVFCGPRTYHRMASGIEDAGFEIRDQMQWIFGSGFPKSMNISIAIDKAAGVMGARGKAFVTAGAGEREDIQDTSGWEKDPGHEGITPEAKQWQGFGTALKPANEPILLARKPLSEKTVAANILRWGCGGLNIDASRVEGSVSLPGNKAPTALSGVNGIYGMDKRSDRQMNWKPAAQGRFPANLVLSHNEDCVEVGVKKVKNQGGVPSAHSKKNSEPAFTSSKETSTIHHFDTDGTETVASFECTPNCAVSMLDAQSGVSKSTGGGMKNADKYSGGYVPPKVKTIGLGDSGGASRFFATFQHEATRFIYCPKASKSERNAGCEGLELDSTEIIHISYGPWEKADLKAVLQVDTAQSVPKVTAASGTWNNSVLGWNTLLFGNSTSELLKENSKSIIRTKTDSTIESKTLNWLAHSFTSVSIQDAKLLTVNGGSLVEHARSLNPLQSTTIDPMDFVINVRFASKQESPETKKSDVRSGNTHPTIKPLRLMSYLIRLVTPPNGICLDPFMGSGSTGVAALSEGFRFIGIEKEQEYITIAEARIAHIASNSSSLTSGIGSSPKAAP